MAIAEGRAGAGCWYDRAKLVKASAGAVQSVRGRYIRDISRTRNSGWQADPVTNLRTLIATRLLECAYGVSC